MRSIILLITGLLLAAGCAGPQIRAVRVAPTPIAKSVNLPPGEQPELSGGGTLTLLDVLQRALRHNPRLAVFSLEMRAREAAALQASLLPNPEVEIEMENFAGGGPVSGFKGTETTFSVGQLIELAGKRSKRTEVANLETELAAWDFERVKLEVYVQAVKLFHEVLFAQEQVKLNREILALTTEFKDQVAFRIAAGRTSEAELARANVEISRAQIALEQSERKLRAARNRLAATWGATHAAFDSVSGQLQPLVSLPSLEQLRQALENSPDLSRLGAEVRRNEASLKLAEAARVPDPVVRVGYRRINEIGQQAFVAGVAVPLKIFDRNQGAVQEARLQVQQAALRKDAVRLQLQTELNSLYQNLIATHGAIQSLREEILPQAQKAFETISAGYKLGKFNFLQVLDAQRSLFGAKETYLQQLSEFQRLRAEIERLTGKPLNQIK